MLIQKEGEPLRKYIQRFSQVQRNIPDVHPAAVISAFHQNVRNRRMREEMAMCKIRDVRELMLWLTSVHGLRREGKSPERLREQKDLRVRIPPRQGRTGDGTTGRERLRMC